MDEIWKEIPWTGGRNAVSNLGRIKRLIVGRGTHVGRLRKLTVDTNGYLSVWLWDSRVGHYRSVRVHTIVGSLFLDKTSDDLEINHIDGNKCNPSAINLEYVTRTENL